MPAFYSKMAPSNFFTVFFFHGIFANVNFLRHDPLYLLYGILFSCNNKINTKA